MTAATADSEMEEKRMINISSKYNICVGDTR